MAKASWQGDPPPARTSLTSGLAAEVVRMVAERGLTAGMRLDSQRDLAAHFGVAVPTMREVLRRLEGMGMLRIRHGAGIFVGENFHRSVVANSLPPMVDRRRLVDLLETRAMIEPAVAGRAAEVRDEGALARLQAVLERAEDCLQRRDDNLWIANMDLHRAVAAVTRNAILEEVVDSLLAIHAQDQREILVLHGDAVADFHEHAEIVRLIVEGRKEEVTDLMCRHLVNVADAITTDATGPDDVG